MPTIFVRIFREGVPLPILISCEKKNCVDFVGEERDVRVAAIEVKNHECSWLGLLLLKSKITIAVETF